MRAKNNSMVQKDNLFYGWTPAYDDGSKVCFDQDTGLQVLQINSLPSLIQAIGYPKYRLYRDGVRIYYRGQTELYKTQRDEVGRYFFQPSALRGVKQQSVAVKVRNMIASQIKELRHMQNSLRDSAVFPDAVLEGLLQQYGLPTTWIDVVDNIWVALWFACFRPDRTESVRISSRGAKVDGLDKVPSRSFVHMIRRDIDEERDGYAYILLLGATDKGRGEGRFATEVVDLRCRIPSVYIRPHVQHGLLIRLASSNELNMVSLIKGVIRIRLCDALKWMGDGRILTPESMMPPPNYDAGFRGLLEGESRGSGEGQLHFPVFC